MSRVSPHIRAISAVFATFAAWQTYWVATAAEQYGPLLPDVFSNIGYWTVGWAIIAVSSTAGAVSGRDWVVRVGFACMAVISMMGAVTLTLTEQPYGLKFWRFGMSATLAAACLMLLLSPLRVPPEHTFPSEEP